MKKTLFTIALAAGLAGTAQAQHSNISLGIKAGPSYSSLVGDQAKNASSFFGFNAGIFANIGITDLIAFQPELLYSQKGAKFDNINTTRHLNYVDVPLMFHVNAEGLFFEAGPQVGFLVAGKDETGNVKYDVKSQYNTLDFGYAAGLGYQRKRGLGIGLRYNGGFVNVPKSYTVGNVTVQDKARNSSFQLYLTYSFGG